MNRILKRMTPGLVLVVALTVAALGPQASAFAEHSVDPSTLNPPPPAEFNPV